MGDIVYVIAVDEGADEVTFVWADATSQRWGTVETVTGIVGDYEIPGFALLERDDANPDEAFFVRVDGDRVDGPFTAELGQLCNAEGPVLDLSDVGIDLAGFGRLELGDRDASVIAATAEHSIGIVFADDAGSFVTRAEVGAAPQPPGNAPRDVFTNPYTFVPFPEAEPDNFRHAPIGHHRHVPDRWSGSIEASFEALTPLLVRAGGHDDGWARDGSGRRIIPGSGWKGALRSLFETVAGGCLRVLDGDFVPVYREPALPRAANEDWRLALVSEVREGRPTKFELCDDVVWVKARHLPAGVSTGDRVGVGATKNEFGRQVSDATVTATPGGHYVVLVQDAATRGSSDYHAACGRLSGRTIELSDRPVNPPDPGQAAGRDRPEHLPIWERYLLEVDGARDLQQHPPGEAVTHSGRTWDRRRVGREMVAGSDVVWLRIEQGANGQDRIVRMSRAVLWRSLGSGRMALRVPDWLLPCTGESDRDGSDGDGAAQLDLCPACRVFGSADVERAEADQAAEQRSYRGHVRFGDLRCEGTFTEDKELAPTGSPRAGAGQFYLSDQDQGYKRAKKDRLPTRQWGSDADGTKLRHVRGRKFYWSADPALQHPRRDDPSAAGDDDGDPNGMANSGTVLEAEAKVRGRLTFENLTAAEVGAILGCLDPNLILSAHRPHGFDDAAPLVFRIGGAKPFGYGALRSSQLTLDAVSPGARYLADHEPGSALECLSTDAAIEAFVDSVPDEVKRLWPDVAAVLSLGHVDPGRVAYPPGARWPAPGGTATDSFYESYAYFGISGGDPRKDQDGEDLRHLVLPSPPRLPDQTLKVHGGGGGS